MDNGVGKGKKMKALEITETIGAKMADLDEAIEAIHYDPTKLTAEDYEMLKEIRGLINQATERAAKIARKCR